MSSQLNGFPPIVAVASPKGGCGKTMVATNLALALARRSDTILADLDIQSGDVEACLGLRPALRMHDIVRRLREDPSSDIDGMLIAVDRSLSVLSSPDSHIAADGLEVADLRDVLDRLRRLERSLVLDTGPGMNEFTIEALERASQIVLVATTDVASVHATRMILDTISAIHLDDRPIDLIVNRSTSRNGLRVSEVEDRLDMKARILVPERDYLAKSLNIGSPVARSRPDSVVSRRFVDLADDLLGLTDAQSPARRDLLKHSKKY